MFSCSSSLILRFIAVARQAVRSSVEVTVVHYSPLAAQQTHRKAYATKSRAWTYQTPRCDYAPTIGPERNSLPHVSERVPASI